MHGLAVESKVALSDGFFTSMFELDKGSQRKVQKKIKKFAEDIKGNGFQVHDLSRTDCDSSFRSARVDRDLRIIFSEQEGHFLLLYVDHHDKAYHWAKGKYLKSSQFGSLYVHDVETLVEREEKFRQTPIVAGPSLLSTKNIQEKELLKLGIRSEEAQKLLTVTNEDEFMEMIINYLPELQEGLMDLVTGSKNITQVYNDLQDHSVGNSSFLNALSHKDSKRRFYVIDDEQELENIINEGFEAWKVFLHPKQKELVTSNFNGPVLIEGGPGTGKSVVGIHRAIYLAKNVFQKDHQKILVCTYSKKLSEYLKEKISQVCPQRLLDSNKIEILGVDQLLFDLVRRYQLHTYEVSANKVKNIIKSVYQELKPRRSLVFYYKEYEEVVQRHSLYSLNSYLRVRRPGLGSALNPHERAEVWVLFEELNKRKKEQRIIDFSDQDAMVYQAISEGTIPPLYSSIIIDEAQDLTPIRLKILKSLCQEKKNDLFILSDQNQRIFRLNSWRSDTKIEVVGRSHYLTLNYRTTRQIREFADNQFIVSTMKQDYLREYKSLLDGPDPYVKDFSSKQQQLSYLIRLLKQYEKNGVQAHDICIITPTELNEVAGVLSYEGIKNTVLKREVYPKEDSGICISTLHGCKGLEFRIVLLLNIDDVIRKNDVEEDWFAKQMKRQEECLKYVAITRAREEVHIMNID